MTNVIEKKFPTYFPPFSWSTVPVYQMFADEVLLSDEDVRKIAPTSDFICIEKQHGINELGGADLGAKHAISQFKAIKPQMKCLVYLNAAYAYPYITRSKVFDYRGEIHRPENARYKSFLITNPETGELAYREMDHVHFFDVLNPELRTWWIETVGNFVRESRADGLFVDQMHGFVWLRQEQSVEVAKAQALMMRMAKDAIGKDKILLLNIAYYVPELFEAGDAFMFEHYCPGVLTKETIVNDWEFMKQIAEAGKMSVWRIGVEHDDKATETTQRGDKVSDAFYENLAKERIDYYLAAFLIGAQEYSYFQYGWGWELKTGPLVKYPELARPLGKPQGDYRRIDSDGWVFTREFEQAKVTVDLEKRQGIIDFAVA